MKLKKAGSIGAELCDSTWEAWPDVGSSKEKEKTDGKRRNFGRDTICITGIQLSNHTLKNA